MATDRALTGVLRAYRSANSPEQNTKILSTTTYLLSNLSNPLNITLLTSQFLIAPAIWDHGVDSRTCIRVISIFNTAAMTVRERQQQATLPTIAQMARNGGIRCDDWATAITKGADEKSPRWRHALVIAGVLLGMESHNRRSLSRGLRISIDRALITATNLALDQSRHGGIEYVAIALALSHTFGLLSDVEKRVVNYDALAPVLIHSMVGPDGYHGAYFIGAIGEDVKQAQGDRFEWAPKSSSFLQLQLVASKPLISLMGPLARLAAHALSNLTESKQIPLLLCQLVEFTEMVAKQWRRNKLSELDPSEEVTFLTQETTTVTFPLLWQVLKTTMFAIVTLLRAIVSRCLVDPVLIADSSAVLVASMALHSLRNLYFVASRLGSNTFSAYTFTFLTSIDILSRFPGHSKAFLSQISPGQPGHIPINPLDRNLDLFFLNTCEHFTLVLGPQDSESLIVTAASPYLNPSAHQNLMEIFEAAHSALLAVLAAPQNAALTVNVVPFYVEALFGSFPNNLSPRQFRFAFKALLQIMTPPAPLSALEPLLAETVLELLHHRAIHAPKAPLPEALVLRSDADAQMNEKQVPLSEQAILMLTLLDVLPFLPYRLLEDWLPLTANVLSLIDDDNMRDFCRNRFWEVLESGEMDVDRAAVCVAWWSTRGGREMVLLGREIVGTWRGPYMSGGLVAGESASRL